MLTVFSTLHSFAQETTSEIQGTITDNSGGLLQGATVTATHTPTGTVYTTTSRKDGRFNLANLRVGGPYILRASFVGYKDDLQQEKEAIKYSAKAEQVQLK